MNNARVSVAMATYNGEKYLKEQIESILCNLNENDELVISDDGSTDNTKIIIENFQKNDKRIKLFDGPKNGVKQNFNNAIEKCQGEYIFLADQDDVWLEGKVEKVLNVFEKEKCTLVYIIVILLMENWKVKIKLFSIIENRVVEY